MSGCLLDTNVLLDIATADATWLAWAVSGEQQIGFWCLVFEAASSCFPEFQVLK